MNNCLLFSVIFLLSIGCSSPQKKEEKTASPSIMNKSYKFLLGTYTEKPDQGIYIISFEPEGEGFTIISSAPEANNPSFVTTTEDEEYVFSVEESGGANGGKITSFSLEKDQLTKINSVSSGGNGPCYVSLDPTEKFVVSGNYSAGTFSVIPVAENGQLQPAVHVIQHEGSSVNLNRQQQPHVHSAVFHPKDHRLLIADLGTDEVLVYDFDPEKEQPLTEFPFYRLQVEPGAGPRHMVFNAEGDRLYLVHEMTAAIGVYSYEEGKLAHLETHSLLSENFDGKVGAAEVRITTDGNYLYVSNRGEANEIIAFEIGDNGSLSHLQTISSGGIAPRNFNITPDGAYLLSGNQNSNQILAFKRDPNTGILEKTNHSLEVYKPVYIKFLD
ncbi:MAG: lactonase family protein [Cyclobacteriaceae bacterium]